MPINNGSPLIFFNLQKAIFSAQYFTILIFNSFICRWYRTSLVAGVRGRRSWEKLQDCASILKTWWKQMSPLSPRHKNPRVRLRRRESSISKPEKHPLPSPSPSPPSLTGKAIHVHQAAIVAAKRLITTSLRLRRWRERRSPSLHPERRRSSFHLLFQVLSGARSSCACKSRAWIRSRVSAAAEAFFRVWDPALVPAGFGSSRLGLGPVGAAGAPAER